MRSSQITLIAADLTLSASAESYRQKRIFVFMLCCRAFIPKENSQTGVTACILRIYSNERDGTDGERSRTTNKRNLLSEWYVILLGSHKNVPFFTFSTNNGECMETESLERNSVHTIPEFKGRRESPAVLDADDSCAQGVAPKCHEELQRLSLYSLETRNKLWMAVVRTFISGHWQLFPPLSF